MYIPWAEEIVILATNLITASLNEESVEFVKGVIEEARKGHDVL
jgi:hypothetical protein